MPLISGFSTSWPKLMSTAPSLVMENWRMVPVLWPAAAAMSKLSSTLVSSMLTSNTRCPGWEVPSYRLAKYSLTCSGRPAVAGKDQFISVSPPPSQASPLKTSDGVPTGTVPSTVPTGP